MRKLIRPLLFVASVAYIVCIMVLLEKLQVYEARKMQRLPDIFKTSLYLLGAFLFKGQDIIERLRSRRRIQVNWILLVLSIAGFALLNLIYPLQLGSSILLTMIWADPFVLVFLCGIALVDAFQFKDSTSP